MVLLAFPLKECAWNFPRQNELLWSNINLSLSCYKRKIHYADCYLISKTIDQKSRKLPIIRLTVVRLWYMKWKHSYFLSPFVFHSLTKLGWPMQDHWVNWSYYGRTVVSPNFATRHGNAKTDSIINRFRKSVCCCSICAGASSVLH